MTNRMSAKMILGVLCAVLVFAIVMAGVALAPAESAPAALAASNEHTVVWDKATLESFEEFPGAGYTKSIKDATTNKTITFTLGACDFSRNTEYEEFYDEELGEENYREVFSGLGFDNDKASSSGFTFSIDTSGTSVTAFTRIEMIGSYPYIDEAGMSGWEVNDSSLVWTGESATVDFKMKA